LAVRAASGSPALPGASSSEAAPVPRHGMPNRSAEAILGLFAEVKVNRREDGGIVLEAPKETADTLATLLQGVAAMLGSISGASRG